MLKTLLISVFVCSAFTVPVVAAEEEKPVPRNRRQVTEEQRALMKELRDKYDANKDGKLDETERKAMSTADKERFEKAFAARRPRNRDEKKEK